jgi:hypothetical protein
MQDCTVTERVAARPAARTIHRLEHRAIGWAEIAGLVEVFPDGSWVPTARAMQYLERERNGDPECVSSTVASGYAWARN